jgi:hypothetical protein
VLIRAHVLLPRCQVRGAEALTLALFGDENRFGKLPITMYNKDYINEVDFHDFSFSKAPGRTYK